MFSLTLSRKKFPAPADLALSCASHADRRRWSKRLISSVLRNNPLFSQNSVSQPQSMRKLNDMF